MNKYEILLDSVDKECQVDEKFPLEHNDGLYINGNIALSSKLKTTVEKSCVLAEEIGHHYTTVGNIMDTSDPKNAKQERQARLWAYHSQIGLQGLIDAYEHGCRKRHEVAEYLEVTEEFLQECIECYRDKYGVGKVLGNYYIMFIPNLMIGKSI